jgi:drug/metabolite transporter (DMT)-like permease
MKTIVIKYSAIILALISAALFGINTPVNKFLLSDINPFLLAGLLYLGASIGLFPIILARGELPYLLKLNRSNRIRLSGSVILGGILGPILILSGLKFASASSVSLWLNLELAATTVLGFLFFKDFLGLKGWIGVVLALISGLILTVNEGNSGILSAALVGSACICWGFDNHFTALIDGISAVQSTFIKGLFAGTLNTAAGWYLSEKSVSSEFIFYALLLGSFSYGISIVLYIISAQKLGAIRSQIIFSSAPFFGVFFSMIFLSETISNLQVVSFSLFVFSIMLFIFEKHEHFHHHHETEHTHFHRHDDMHHEHHHDKKVSYHEHLHRHKSDEHAHPHWPDMHHRHKH